MGWDEDHADVEDRWDSALDGEDHLLSVLSDKDILGVCDGYDDYKIDTIFAAFIKARQRLRDEGVISD